MEKLGTALSELLTLIEALGTDLTKVDGLKGPLAQAKALAQNNGAIRIATEIEHLERFIWKESEKALTPRAQSRFLQLNRFFKLFATRLRSLAENSAQAGPTAKKRVLIIEDSKVTQLLLSKFLSTQKLEVVGQAVKEDEVFHLIETTCPDVITLDIFLGGSNGFALLDSILNRFPIPIVLISSIQGPPGIQVFHALYRGCLDFISKVSLTKGLDQVTFSERVWKAANAPLISMAKYYCDPVPASLNLKAILNPKNLLAIGVAIGGIRSLIDVLTTLPQNIPPILIGQTLAPDLSQQLIQILKEVCPFNVREAIEGEELKPGIVLLAPPGKTLMVTPGTPARVLLETNSSDPSLGETALNQLLGSVATASGTRTGLLLGGSGVDGAVGLAEIRKHGGITIVEDEAASFDPTLSREALLIGGAITGTDSEYLSEIVTKALTYVEKLDPQTVPLDGPKKEAKIGRVLIADDSPTIRAVLRHGLQALGMTDFYEVKSGADAWTQLEKLVSESKALDLIISDQNMPGMTGKDLLFKIREHAQLKKVPFILATAETDQAQVLDAVKRGVSDYITKPVSLELFKKKVKAVLDKAKVA